MRANLFSDYLAASQFMSPKGIIYSGMPIRFIFLMLFSATVAKACSCSLPVAKNYRVIAEWQVNHSPVIFEGRVESLKVTGWPIKPVAGETVSIIPGVTVSFSSVHVYRGETPAELVVETGLGGGDCGFDFAPGESYLVFAGKAESGKLSTSICGGTTLLEEAGAPLRLLRGEAATAADLTDPRTNVSKPTTLAHQVCGKISAPPEVRMLSVRVVFWRVGQEAVANFRYETVLVHPDGSYCMDDLRPGKYLMGATYGNTDESSTRYMSYYPGTLDRSKATEIAIQDKAETARADFALLTRPLYSVHGYLRGAPENSTQPVQIMLLSAVQDRFHAVEAAELGPHGFFEIEDVPPGRYTIFAMTQNEDNALTFLSEGVDIDVDGNIEGFKLDYVEKK